MLSCPPELWPHGCGSLPCISIIIITTWPNNSIRIAPNEAQAERPLAPTVHCSTIHHSQTVETTHVTLTGDFNRTIILRYQAFGGFSDLCVSINCLPCQIRSKNRLVKMPSLSSWKLRCIKFWWMPSNHLCPQ